ncbi:hypothetical protein ACH5RR_000181 [Cinchona calisaya]|uniref:DUF4378 domain-containing protein n=1 Tax=Cinchona calisaya TaxID=153742 RepID=A0ABD3AZW9_9GENT
MAKKSQRRPLRYEKDQTGCISGLISIFDFRHGRSTRKLLPDRRRGSRQAVGSRSSHTQEMLLRSNEKSQDTEDGTECGIASSETAKTSVKKLMEEEMFNEQGPIKHTNDPEVGQEIFYPEPGCHTRRNRKHTNKSCKRTNDINLCDTDAVKDLGPQKPCDGVDNQKTSDKIDFEIIMHLLHDHFDMRSDQASAVDEGKLSAAIKIFIDQSSSKIKHSREDGLNQQSAEFMDALDRLSSKKDLLLKLLQDPNSLLVEQIKGLESANLERDLHSNSLPRSSFLEDKLNLSKTDELINHKQNRKFFRRRSKSQESFLSMASEKCQSSSKIVILKPGSTALRQQNAEMNVSTSMQSDYQDGNKIQGERSQFSFTEIKRKLKHAMRKERLGISPDGITHKNPLDHQKQHDFDKGVGGENVGWRSPNRNHFYTERFAKPSMHVKRGDTISKPNDTETSTVKETAEHTKPGISNIYLEAKKHLLEMLSSGDDDAELNSQQLPKSLGRILSFSEYNYSPNSSPRTGTEDSSVAAERTLSPCGGIGIVKQRTDQLVQENLDDHSSPQKYSSEIESRTTCVNPDEGVGSLEASRSLSSEHNHANLEEENLLAAQDATISEGATGIEETTKLGQEDNEIPDASCQFNSPYGMEDGQNGDVAGECHEDSSRQSLEMKSLGECQTVSSPSYSSVKVEDFEGAIDRTERPSPVSVLEPLFVEDDISPARTMSRPVELEIQPRQIHFEEWRSSNEQAICVQTSLEDEESAFEYVEAVLLGSGLVWDEYLLRWLSSSPVLDSVLYDEVELFSSRSHHEQRLLFDCTNEVLEEVCDRYFGCFPLMSISKQNIRPVPTRMNLIHEIWEGVEWHLLQYPQPRSLDQLLKKDMAKSRTWMDLRSEIRHIGTEMEEAILDNLVEDTISSLIYDALESDFLASSADPNEVHSIDL